MRVWSAFDLGIPALDPLHEPQSASVGRCTLCGGDLDSHVLPWHRASYPGQVEHRCTVCGVVETAAMRGRVPVLGQGPRARPWSGSPRLPRVARPCDSVMVPCARMGCQKRFLYVPGSPGRRREYCCRPCREAAQVDRYRAQRQARRA